MLVTVTDLTNRLRRSAFAFPLAVLVAGLMVGISELAYHEAESQLRLLAVMGQVRLEVSRVLRRVTDAESGQRGYLLTGQAEYLTPYQNASRDVQNGIERLQAMYRQLDDQTGMQRLARMADEMRTKLSELDEVIALDVAGQTRQARELTLTGIGRDQMDGIRRYADLMLADEDRRVTAGMNNVFDTLLLNRIGVSAMTGISLLVLAMFLRQSRLLDRQRLEQQAEVRAERDRLESEVAARTAELTELARHLETAREDERAKLARDLHDELGALLTAAKLDVARVRPRLQAAAPELMPRMAHLIETLNSGIALKRRIIEDLRPSTLDNLGLPASLEVLCGEFGERLGVQMKTRFEPVSLTRSADLTVFRLVQESLNNIAKHAEPTEVEVTIEAIGDDARICVRDNGGGFDTRQVSGARHGLIGMRYRVEAESGQLRVDSTPGQGTTVTARLPQQPAAALTEAAET